MLERAAILAGDEPVVSAREIDFGVSSDQLKGGSLSMEIESRMSEALGRYLDLATSEIKLTAANMANIDTPGYKAVGLDFEAEMRQALGDVNKGSSGRPARVRVVDGLISRPDGNDVSMDREGLNLAEAQLKFRVGVTLLRAENQRVMDAIQADSK